MSENLVETNLIVPNCSISSNLSVSQAVSVISMSWSLSIYTIAVSFSYSSLNSDEVSMKVSRNGNKKNGATFKSDVTDVTPDQMR